MVSICRGVKPNQGSTSPKSSCLHIGRISKTSREGIDGKSCIGDKTYYVQRRSVRERRSDRFRAHGASCRPFSLVPLRRHTDEYIVTIQGPLRLQRPKKRPCPWPRPEECLSRTFCTTAYIDSPCSYAESQSGLRAPF
jgi:hypothetical protein